MSGTNNPSAAVAVTGVNGIDGLTFGRKWAETTVNYGFTVDASNYGAYVKSGNRPIETPTHSDPTAGTMNAARFAMEGRLWAGSSGFGIEGFTNVNIVEAVAPAVGVLDAHVRYGQTNNVPGTNWGGYASFPGTDPVIRAGDIWLQQGSYTDVRPGTISWYNVLHETGHSMGLKHPFDTYAAIPGHPVLNTAYDAMEYTVMSYNSYVGEDSAVLSGNGTYDYAQTYMMFDIRALQHMYGADYTTNNTDTEYRWSPSNGDTLVNGQLGIDAAGNKIFATIWDGGGSDTYNLSAYTTNLTIDLRPGEYSNFGTSQAANLGNGQTAKGMIYNAFLFNNDTRSLIENAVGGSGNDEIIGNVGLNRLDGGGGSDTLFGEGGADTLLGGLGNDVLLGGAGADVLNGGAGVDTASYAFATSGVTASLHISQGTQGEAQGDTYQEIENLQGSSYADLLVGNNGNNTLWGGAGNDRLNASAGNDILVGGAGDDTFVFGAGVTGRDIITDFNTGNTEDRIDLRGNEYLFDWLAVLLNMYQVGANVEIRSADSDVIVINNAQLAALDSGDFIFT